MIVHHKFSKYPIHSYDTALHYKPKTLNDGPLEKRLPGCMLELCHREANLNCYLEGQESLVNIQVNTGDS